jgi:hypothetical protein
MVKIANLEYVILLLLSIDSNIPNYLQTFLIFVTKEVNWWE